MVLCRGMSMTAVYVRVCDLCDDFRVMNAEMNKQVNSNT